MAAVPLDVAELHELVTVLAVTLDRVQSDMLGAQETPCPIRPELNAELEQRDAFVAVMKRLPEDVRAKIRTLFVEEVGKLDGRDEMASMPTIIEDSEERIREALELVRCSHLRDRDLWHRIQQDLGPHWL